MRLIIEKYNVGEIISDRNPEKLAKQIENILQKGKEYYTKQLEIASKELNWENESKKLIEIYNNIE